MPVFSIETPGGKVLDIEAADEDAAVRGAKEWDLQSNSSKLSKLWDNPPAGPSMIGAARHVYDALQNVGQTNQQAMAPMPATMTEEDQFLRNQARDQLPIDAFKAAAAVQGPVSPSVRNWQLAAPQIANTVPPKVADSPLLDAANSINVSIPRILATESGGQQRLGNSISNMPIVGEPIRNAVEKTVNEMGAAATDIAKGYGAGSREIAGDSARLGIVGFIKKASRDAEGDAFNALKTKIDPDYKSPLNSTESILNTINLRRSEAGRDKSGITKEFGEALSRDGLTVEGIKDLRSSFGPNVRQQLLNVKGLDEAEVKQVYGALTRDYENAVFGAGGDAALSALKEANAVSRLMNVQRKQLEKIVGPFGDAPAESVFEKLVAMAGSKGRADHQRLNLAKMSIGNEGWNEVASALMMRMGRDPEGKFSADRFLTAIGNLSDVGRKSIFESTEKRGLSDALKSLEAVSSAVKDKVSRFQNTSRTAPTMMGAMGLAGLITSPVTTLATALGSHVMARALAEPATVRAMTNWSTAYGQAVSQPSKGRVDLLGPATKALAVNIQRISGGDVAAITRQIESVVTGRAEGDAVLPSRERQ